MSLYTDSFTNLLNKVEDYAGKKIQVAHGKNDQSANVIVGYNNNNFKRKQQQLPNITEHFSIHKKYRL